MAKTLTNKDFGVDYLDFSQVKIDFSKPQIIWAPNGVGKTSLYKGLQQGQLPTASFAEFNNNRPGFVKDAKDTLRIGASVRRLDTLQSSREQLLNDCGIQRNLKDVGLTAAGPIKKTFPTHPNCKKDHAGNLSCFSADAAKRLCDTIPERDAAFFVTNWQDLATAKSLKDDFESLKSRMVSDVTSQLLKWIDEDTTICPVCGAEKTEPIAIIIRAKRAELAEKESQLTADYAKIHTEQSAEEIRIGLQRLCTLAGSADVDEGAVFSFAICGGRKDAIEPLNNAKEKLATLDKEIRQLANTKKRFYENIRKREDEITNLLQVKFELGPNAISFDDASDELLVKLPRELDKFSTGEIDLMVALVSINEFRASDSDVLVLDDPITSFDMSNQYTVLFDLVSLVEESKMDGHVKSIVILTHNTNCINIAESQRPALFNYFALDRWSDGLRLNPIKLKKDSTRRYLCQSTLLWSAKNDFTVRPNGLSLGLEKAYIAAACEREGGRSDLHKVFHYDAPGATGTYNGQSLSNDQLIDLIDSIPADILIGKDNFIESCLDKELIMIALRIWIEKQFYDHMAGDAHYQAETSGKSISEKINYIFPKDRSSRWHGPATITRSYLMSKKVMLNQASHENAQPVPFEYALGLSSHEIQKIIEDIKKHFRKTPMASEQDQSL